MTREELRSAILAAEDITVEPVPTPEWGPAIDGQVYVRLFSLGGRWAYFQSIRPVLDGPDSGGRRDSGLRLAAQTMSDAHGALLFTEADTAALGEKSWTALQRVIDASADLNRLSAASLADAKKNSPIATARPELSLA